MSSPPPTWPAFSLPVKSHLHVGHSWSLPWRPSFAKCIPLYSKGLLCKPRMGSVSLVTVSLLPPLPQCKFSQSPFSAMPAFPATGTGSGACMLNKSIPGVLRGIWTSKVTAVSKSFTRCYCSLGPVMWPDTCRNLTWFSRQLFSVLVYLGLTVPDCLCCFNFIKCKKWKR